MAVAHEAVGHKASVARALTLHWSRLPYIPCTAAAPHLSLERVVGLQLAQIKAAGIADEKALLADVTAKNLDASCIELERLFKVHHSVADGHSYRACCIVPAARCPRTSARSCRA